ncbi:citrate synthase family protein [Undibacterium sp.]|jgi:citrate synthase|uniref:citrate synthase family protein n=1 Tax=Undibacterium sp. TaxID=1914977 RepID=UPI002BB7640E|nr:citrate synthase family protein [Undibacterium sp.]HTD05358.1 citrate synthase family protein [Undibacterium sp.]
MKKTLSAAEAASLLGISLPTLYAYVSRGMLHSISDEGARSKRYLHDEVLRLAARNTDSRRAGRTAEHAIDWGVPVLESLITLIADGKLHYRGHDAIALAQTATLEQVAQLLWEHEGENLFGHGGAEQQDVSARLWRSLQTPLAKLPPLDRAMSLLPAIAPHLRHTWDRTEAGMLRAGARLMQVLAAALVGGAISDTPLHLRIAQAWNVDEQAADLLRAAMVLCADHELNASTFTVRCVASTGAHLYAAVTAGLAALSGPRHGGESLRVRALLDAALEQDELPRFLAERLQHAGRPTGYGHLLAGFGHPLYPQGDPRGKLLLQMLPRFATQDKARTILAIADAGQQVTGQFPNVDFGLAALELACGWPRSAGQVLFALGRSAGWIAHAMEQVADGRLIRPRARYIGSFELAD